MKEIILATLILTGNLNPAAYKLFGEGQLIKCSALRFKCDAMARFKCQFKNKMTHDFTSCVAKTYKKCVVGGMHTCEED